MAIRGKKIFITSGAGFIGSTLASKLCNDNELVLFDNLARNTIKHTNLLDNKNITLIEGDLDYEAVSKAMQGGDTVSKFPVTTMEVNMVGTSNVL